MLANTSLLFGGIKGLDVYLKVSKQSPATPNKPKKIRILHLIGSTHGDAHFKLSQFFARKCVASLQDKVSDEMQFCYLYVYPNHFSFSYDFVDLRNEFKAKYSLHEMRQTLKQEQIDVFVSHIMDGSNTQPLEQMLTDLRIGCVGNDLDSIRMANYTPSLYTVLRENDIPVPNTLCLPLSSPTISEVQHLLSMHGDVKYPLIVRECTKNQCHSSAKHICYGSEQLEQYIAARQNASQMVIEPLMFSSRELRMAVIEDENGNANLFLPCMQRVVLHHKPMQDTRELSCKQYVHRMIAQCDKYELCTLQLNGALKLKLQSLVQKAHVAVGAQRFSVFDIRLDLDDNPYVVDAHLFSNFSPTSTIVSMADAAQDPKLQHVAFFKHLVHQAMKGKCRR